ncbi:unnamed protein product, partial [Symbiodinium pilosum]
MAAESKARKRQIAGTSPNDQDQQSPPGNVWQIGRFRINLGRIPEFLMLLLLAFVVA